MSKALFLAHHLANKALGQEGIANVLKTLMEIVQIPGVKAILESAGHSTPITDAIGLQKAAGLLYKNGTPQHFKHLFAHVMANHPEVQSTFVSVASDLAPTLGVDLTNVTSVQDLYESFVVPLIDEIPTRLIGGEAVGRSERGWLSCPECSHTFKG